MQAIYVCVNRCNNVHQKYLYPPSRASSYRRVGGDTPPPPETLDGASPRPPSPLTGERWRRRPTRLLSAIHRSLHSLSPSSFRASSSHGGRCPEWPGRDRSRPSMAGSGSCLPGSVLREPVRRMTARPWRWSLAVAMLCRPLVCAGLPRLQLGNRLARGGRPVPGAADRNT
jgi:hypothetical protein